MRTRGLTRVLPTDPGPGAAAVLPEARRPRGWRRVVLAAVLGLLLMFGSLLGIAIAEPEAGPGYELIAFLDAEVGRNESVHYNIHRGLGHAFSICPCTARLAASQFEKANYHRPR